jgi:hypothetical protein
MQIVETVLFIRQTKDLMSADDLQDLQATLIVNPKLGAVIPGGGGLRKLRWRLSDGNMGKRSGWRVIYYYLDRNSTLFLLAAYRKGDQVSLSKRHLSIYSNMIKEFK